MSPTAALGDLCELVRGVNYKKEQASGESSAANLPILRATNINGGSLLLDRDLVYVDRLAIGNDQLLRRGDIVIATSSGSASVVGKSALFDADWEGAFGAFCGVLRPHGIDPKFLAYRVSARDIREKWTTDAVGTNINNLKRSHILDTAILVPLPEEQQRTVTAIEEHFTHLDAAERAIERADTLAVMCGQALAESLVREGELHSLGELGEVITGGTPSTSNASLWGGDTPFVTPGDLVHGEAVAGARRSLTGLGTEKARVVPAQSVLVTCIGATIGKSSVSKVECAVNQQINAVVPNRSLVLPEWLIAAVSALSFQEVIRGNASSTTMPILNKSKFRNLQIRVPSLETQAALIEKYYQLAARLNHGRSATNRVRNMIKVMRRGVLTAAFGERSF